jgi:putative FmdB family regulatory protein
VPTYQYACTACNHRFEAVQSFSDASLTECPVCAGHLRKVFSSVGIVFKGSGFYRTDSRSGAGGTVAEAAKTETASESKSDSKSDSKSGTNGAASTSGSSSKDSSSSSSSSSAAPAAAAS